MKSTRELYDLIKSMSGSEKRYFQLSVSLQKGNKNYLKLFNSIDKNRIQDDKELLTKFRNDSFIKNLTITKNYLFKLIIRVLTNYRNERSVDLKLNSILSKCKLMYEKGLFPLYFKTVRSGKESALKHERFNILLDFIEHEKNLVKKDEIGKKDMNKIYDYESEVIEWIKIISHYKKIISNLFTVIRIHGTIRNESLNLQVNTILSENTGIKIKDDLPLRALENIYLAKYLECRLKGEYEESINFCKLRLNLVSKNPDVFKDFLLDPVYDSYGFHISSALQLKNYREARSVFNKLKKITDKEGNIDLTISDYDIRLNENTERENKFKGDKLIAEIEKYFIRHRGKILVNTENYLRYNFVKYYLMTENYEIALKYINDYLGSKLTKLTPEFESYSRILNVIIHYELGNHSLLKHLIPTTKKYLINKKKYFRFESEILKSISRLITLKDDTLKRKAIANLFDKSMKLKKDRYERNAFGYFDLEKWTEKKII